MLSIPPIRQSSPNHQLPISASQPRSSEELYSSSICFAGKEGFFSGCIAWSLQLPGKILSKIKNGILYLIFCRCFCSGEEKLDWKKTKVPFGGIHTAVHSSVNELKHRVEMFKTHLNELSNPARERFNEHIGFAHARKVQGCKDRAKQEEWYQKNKGTFPFGDYLGEDGNADKSPNLNNPVLKEAVTSFWEELEAKAKETA